MNLKVKWGGINNTLILKMQKPLSSEDMEDIADNSHEVDDILTSINKKLETGKEWTEEHRKILGKFITENETLGETIRENLDWVKQMLEVDKLSFNQVLKNLKLWEGLSIEIQGTLETARDLTREAGEMANKFSAAGQEQNIVAAGLESISNKLITNANNRTRAGKLNVKMYTSMVDKTQEILQNVEKR